MTAKGRDFSRYGLLGSLVLLGLSCWVFGPSFVRALRPHPGEAFDFIQEWLSARNALRGAPVYENLNAALARYPGEVPGIDCMGIPWNAHPPVSVLLVLPFASWNYPNAHLAWNLISLMGLAYSLFLLARAWQVPVTPPAIVLAMALVLAFDPLRTQIQLGQLNLVLLPLLMLAWAADRRGRALLAGSSIGVAAAIKLFPAFLLLYFLGQKNWRALAAAILTFLVLQFAAFLILGGAAFHTYLFEVLPTLRDYQSNWQNLSFQGFTNKLFDPLPQDRIVPLFQSRLLAKGLAMLLNATTAGVFLAASWRARTIFERERAFALGLVAMLLASPICWPHTFVLLLLPLALCWKHAEPGLQRGLLALLTLAFALPFYCWPALCLGVSRAFQMGSNLQDPPLIPAEVLLAASLQSYALVSLMLVVRAIPANVESNPPPSPLAP